MATRQQPEQDTVNLPVVGEEGEACAQCGSLLAPDQRYCVNCGWRRGDTRVDYQRQLVPSGAPPASAAGPAGATQWSPFLAIGAIALLGIMLLLGVLIGKDDNPQQVVAGTAAPPTTTTAAAPAAPTATTAAKPAKGAAAGKGNIEKGGSGSTEGVATADTAALEEAARSGQGAQAGKSLPNQVATGGEQEATDPGGIKNAGNGSGATCIGC